MHAMTTQRKTEEPDSPSDSAPFSAATVHPSKPHGPLDPPDLHSLNFSNSSRNTVEVIDGQAQAWVDRMSSGLFPLLFPQPWRAIKAGRSRRAWPGLGPSAAS